MQVTLFQWRWLDSAPLETIRTDPTRMARGIMTAIGFLGAGVIFKEGLTVRGLTTAASIWTTAAIGILFGTGMYFPAVTGTLLAVGILAAFRWIEDRTPSQFYAHLAVTYPKDQTPSEEAVRGLLKDHGFKVANMSYELRQNGTAFEYRTVIKSARKANATRLAEDLRAAEHLIGFSISPTGD